MSNLSFVRHKGDGTTTQFALSVNGENIGYFRVSDIHGYVDDKEVPIVIEPSSSHIVIITPAPKAGADILLRREMPVKKPYADFERGNNFGQRQVNNSFLQQLYLTQELLDGFMPEGYYMKQNIDMGGHRAVNCGKEVDKNDHVIKETTDKLDARLVALETSATSESRFVSWNHVAVGGEDTINPPYNFFTARVYINGVRQTIEKAYVIVDKTIMFAEPLEEGDEVDVELGMEPKDASPVNKSFVEETTNAGDSQIAGGKIWPTKNRDTSVNDKPQSAEFFKFTYQGKRRLYKSASPVTGAITAIGQITDSVDITVGGSRIPLTLNENISYTVDEYGAAGNAVISMAKPLYYFINKVEHLLNPDAKDDTAAIKAAIDNESLITFNGKKGYLVSDCFRYSESNKRLIGNGAVIVYKGGRTKGLEQDDVPIGIFAPMGSVDRFTARATPTSGIDVFSNTFTVATASNTLVVGDWFLFYGSNGVTDFANEILKYAYYPAQVSKVTDVGGGNTEIAMSYKSGFSFLQSEIQIGTFTPCDNPQISGFRLLDAMTATPTPDILPVPQAPVAERREAVGLVYARNVTNLNIYDMQSYNGLYPCVTVYTTANSVIENIRNFKPRWFGGGEGYCVRAVTSSYLNTKNLSMLGGRHVIDWTTCGWFNHDAGNGNTDQVSFSAHTQCEHDGVISNVVGGDFYLANAAFGEVCTRITLDNCTFTKVRIKCLHLTIQNSQLNDFECDANKCTIKNTNITNFAHLNKETRTGADSIVSEYAEAGKLRVDSQSGFKRKKGYTPGTKVGGWYYADIENRWSSDANDTRYSVEISDVANIKFAGRLIETNLAISGISRNIDTRGLSASVSRADINPALVAISSLDVPVGEVLSINLRNMNLDLNGLMRPYQIVSRPDFVRHINCTVSFGGGVYKNCVGATISDVGSNLTILGIARGHDAYNNGNFTQLDSANLSIKFEAGKTYKNPQTDNVPKWFDGVAFQSFS